MPLHYSEKDSVPTSGGDPAGQPTSEESMNDVQEIDDTLDTPDKDPGIAYRED